MAPATISRKPSTERAGQRVTAARRVTASEAKSEAARTLERLQRAHPDAHCELVHENPFQLLVATVLSAQSTDVMVNKVTPILFARWPGAEALASADVAEVETTIKQTGFFRQKTKSIIGIAKKLVEKHGGEVPQTLEELVQLPGVGRKTANVVLGVAFGKPEGVVVDTHVQRISQRLGWTKHTTPENIEQDLMRLFPRESWDPVAHILIFHGRRICTARKPACAACPVSDICPSAFRAEKIGRKPPRVRLVQASKKAVAAVKHKKRGAKRAKTVSRAPKRRGITA